MKRTRRLWVVEGKRRRKGANWKPAYTSADVTKKDAEATAAMWNKECAKIKPVLMEYRVRAYSAEAIK